MDKLKVTLIRSVIGRPQNQRDIVKGLGLGRVNSSVVVPDNAAMRGANLMKLHELKPAEGSRQVRNRVGRGTSSGNGKTAGRGQKGQKARGKVRLGFEGGQMPLFRRMPKRGFKNINRKEYAIVNLETLNKFEDGAEVTPALLVESGIIKDEKDGIKVLGNGTLNKQLTVKASKFSASAKEAIESKGGKAEVI